MGFTTCAVWFPTTSVVKMFVNSDRLLSLHVRLRRSHTREDAGSHVTALNHHRSNIHRASTSSQPYIHISTVRTWTTDCFSSALLGAESAYAPLLVATILDAIFYFHFRSGPDLSNRCAEKSNRPSRQTHQFLFSSVQQSSILIVIGLWFTFGKSGFNVQTLDVL